MRHFISVWAAAAAVLASAVSCAVHEWPVDAPADVELRLDFNTDMPQFMVLNTGGTRASHDGADYCIRYVVEAYRFLPDGSVSDTPHGRWTFTKGDLADLNSTFRFSIDEGEYRFHVWTDFVVRGTSDDFFYGTDKFRRVTLLGTHEGNNDYRDAFVGSADLTVRRLGSRQTPSSVTVPMERPLAKFEFVTTDLQEFITKTVDAMLRKEAESRTDDAAEGTGADGTKGGDSDEDTKGDGSTKSPAVDLNKFRVVFYYSGYMPCAFNVMENKPCDSATGVRFSSTITAIDSHEARLGFDYVFVNGRESSVMVTVGLFDEDGVQLSMSNPIEVPIKRSMLTVVKGSFLMQNTGGGVAIDPGFDGEYNIVLR